MKILTKTTAPLPQHKLDGWDLECVICGCKWMEEADTECPQCAMKDKPLTMNNHTLVGYGSSELTDDEMLKVAEAYLLRQRQETTITFFGDERQRVIMVDDAGESYLQHRT